MKHLLVTLLVALAAIKTVSAETTTMLFQEDFSTDLSHWTGRFDTNHHGKIVVDPLDSGNKALTFTATSYSGDIFSRSISAIGYTQILLSFDYLGLGSQQNLGGFVGIRATDTATEKAAFVAGTDQSAANGLGFDGIQITDDSHWHTYTIDLTKILKSNGITSFQINMEDWADAGGIGAGDAFFDNFKVTGISDVPWLELTVSRIKVTQHVTPGKNYLLESSADFKTWTTVGVKFTATSETVTQEFDVQTVGKFYRITEVP